MNIGSYQLLRATVGVSMLGHGVVRLGKLPAFAGWLELQFAETLICGWLIRGVGTLLPILEFTIGLGLLIGFSDRWFARVGAILMIGLIAGSCMIEKWEYIPSQMIHVAFFLMLLHWLEGLDPENKQKIK